MALLHYRALMVEFSKAIMEEINHYHPGSDKVFSFLLRTIAELEMTEVLA